MCVCVRITSLLDTIEKVSIVVQFPSIPSFQDPLLSHIPLFSFLFLALDHTHLPYIYTLFYFVLLLIFRKKSRLKMSFSINK